MKTPIMTAAVLLLVPLAARSQDLSGHVTVGAQLFEADPESSKVNEYRELDDGLYLYSLDAEGRTASGHFLDLGGANVGRDDQTLRLRIGRTGRWSFGVAWDEIPHRLSNKARTPLLYDGEGALTAPATVPIVAGGRTLVPTAVQQVANDSVTAAYLATFARPVPLGNERDRASLALEVSPTRRLRLRLSASNEDRDGNKITYGPIGDRPPRSLNIQMTEPIEYRTQEVRFEGAWAGSTLQAAFAYALSAFENGADVLTWQNIYTDPAAGTFETWDRPVATFGRRALPQDSLQQTASLTLAVDLPLNSRLSATGSYSRAEQDESLIPYSTLGVIDPVAGGGDDRLWNDPAKLPRPDAGAEVETTLLNVEYAVIPLPRLDLRAFYRFLDLANGTPTEQWRYVTNDVTSATGAVTYLNKRRNLAVEYDKQNYGAAAGYGLRWWGTNLGLAFEREVTGREFREADTDENIFTVSVRSRPARLLSLRARFRYGDREADHYEGEAAHETYWYAPADATDNVDSQFTFESHPDTRRYDVTDRVRQLLDVVVAANPIDRLDVSASYRYRRDDYDSDVRPSQPLLSYAGARPITDADRNAFSPGDQLGLLDDERHVFGVDVGFALGERLRLDAFGSLELADTRQRGLEFDENHKVDPTWAAGATAELGPWTRRTQQWMAEMDDTTWTAGVGSALSIVPRKLDLGASYAYSEGAVDIEYTGFGAVSSLDPAVTLPDNYQFAFRSPPTVRNARHSVSATLSYQVTRSVGLSLGYLFERLTLSDWSQEAYTPWFEAVDGNELLLRDTSQSTQWGNRLPNLGSYLAPGYDLHVASVMVTVRT